MDEWRHEGSPPPVQGQVSAASRTSDTKSKRVRMCLGCRGWACGKYSNCACRLGRCCVRAQGRCPRYSFRGTTTSSRAQGDSPRDAWPPALFVFCPLLPLVPNGGADWAKGGEARGAPLVRSACGRGWSLCVCTPWRVELPAEHPRGIIIYQAPTVNPPVLGHR